MHKTIVAATAVLLISAGVYLAQPAGITCEMIERALPVEGAPFAEPGRYKVTSERAFGSPGHLAFRPATLDAFPKKDKLPVMVWGNGGCAIDSTRSSGFLTTIAAQVQGNAAPGAPSPAPTSDALPKLHGPVLLINGHEPDFMMAQSAGTFDSAMFAGKNCNLCTNSNRDVQSKGIKE